MFTIRKARFLTADPRIFDNSQVLERKFVAFVEQNQLKPREWWVQEVLFNQFSTDSERIALYLYLRDRIGLGGQQVALGLRRVGGFDLCHNYHALYKEREEQEEMTRQRQLQFSSVA